MRAVGADDLPPARRAEVQLMHRSLIAPLHEALAALGDVDPGQLARYVWGVVEVASSRIESGECVSDDEIATVLEFVHGGPARSITVRN